MPTETAVIGHLPEELELAELHIQLNLDNEGVARKEAEALFTELEEIFCRKHVELALLYDLDIEIVASSRGSWEFVSKAKLQLKEGWKRIKKATPSTFLAVSMVLTGVAHYPDVRQGGKELYEDLKSVYEQVISEKQKTDPDLIKGGKVIPIIQTDKNPKKK